MVKLSDKSNWLVPEWGFLYAKHYYFSCVALRLYEELNSAPREESEHVPQYQLPLCDRRLARHDWQYETVLWYCIIEQLS